uniref:serine hydrolase n=1 Tax=Mycolicibacterium palauense TaxID=2034511 RepID=UPI001145870A
TPDSPQNLSAPPFAGLNTRALQATTDAADEGADIAFLVLDRETGHEVSSGNTRGLATASVAKLFIADDLLMREPDLSPDDRRSLDVMLRSSDDDAAEMFWNRGGGDAIITRVAGRYGLGATSPPDNGRWWNTVTSAQDLVQYYDMLLNGTGGLPPERANIIVNNLAQSTPNGIDGYPQRFGIPDGLYAEPVAVKQGWMCCVGSDWMHLSTGIIGSDRRYLMVIYSLQPTDAATARATITQAVKTMFPDGRI